jgi:hypothetical protein
MKDSKRVQNQYLFTFSDTWKASILKVYDFLKSSKWISDHFWYFYGNQIVKICDNLDFHILRKCIIQKKIACEKKSKFRVAFLQFHARNQQILGLWRFLSKCWKTEFCSIHKEFLGKSSFPFNKNTSTKVNMENFLRKFDRPIMREWFLNYIVTCLSTFSIFLFACNDLCIVTIPSRFP